MNTRQLTKKLQTEKYQETLRNSLKLATSKLQRKMQVLKNPQRLRTFQVKLTFTGKLKAH